MRNAIFSTVLLACLSSSAPAAETPEFSFHERVRAQERIEQFYAAHRSGSRRTFAEAASGDVIERKVQRYLAQTAALERFWSQRLTADALDAELRRMMRQSRDLSRLRELFAILDDDPHRIRETLVRPIVVDRTIRAAYASSPPPDVAGADPAPGFDAWWSIIEPTITGWSAKSLPVTGSTVDESLPLERLQSSTSRSAAKSTTGFHWRDSVFDSIGRRDYVSVWTGTELIVWGGNDAVNELNTGMRYDPILGTTTTTSVDGAPQPRSRATAVWTGQEMIVWGGSGSYTPLSSGARYDPATDTWTSLPQADAPLGRTGHTAVWTGTEMIIWRGYSNGFLDSGGRYDPSTDQWVATGTTGAPTARSSHTAVWTGGEMIVWGGRADLMSRLQTGGRYDPDADSWSATAIDAFVPRQREDHTAVWTGYEMIVWGGRDVSTRLDSGGRYNPAFDKWNAMSIQSATPTTRYGHSAVWTGSRMIVWGGHDFQELNDGAQYDPLGNDWSPIADVGAPAPRYEHTAFWTGSQMLVFGGFDPTLEGGRYHPPSNQWTAFSVGTDVPEYQDHSAVWTGVEMLVWGDEDSPPYAGTGFRYDPILDSITSLSTVGAPSRGRYQASVWTGDEMIVWGGAGSGCTAATNGARYDPVSGAWSSMTTVGAPEGGIRPTAAWTGERMLVWGGRTTLCDEYIYDDDGNLVAICPYPASVSGALYDPVGNSWEPIPDAPLGQRDGYASAWTGTQLLIWGGLELGCGPPHSYANGARYNVATGQWFPISTAGAPPADWRLASGWSGSEMLVWITGTSGARYHPGSNQWRPMTGIDAPQSECNTAVWSGDEWIVWGVNQANPDYGSGARYDPVLDRWVALPTAGAMHPGCFFDGYHPYHTAVWTGSEMIVFGPDPERAFPRGSVLSPGYQDWDGDGWADETDNCPYVPNVTQADQDGDGFGNACDEDDDDDGVLDGSDNCPLGFNPSQTDGDGDSVGDACDNCVATPNPAQQNADADGLGDACDPCPQDAANDVDADGICAGDDNCPEVANPDQADTDGDGIGDSCDPCWIDLDADGLCDRIDNCPFVPNVDQLDADADGVGDVCDNCPTTMNHGQHDLDDPGQWAVSATASSEWSPTDWSAMQTTGSPESVEICEDRPTSWSPATGGSAPEWIELTYAVPVHASSVRVHESWESGFVAGIELIDDGGTAHPLPSQADATPCGGTLERKFPATSYLVSGLRLTTAVEGWEEIDAVRLISAFPDGVGDACDVCPGVLDPEQTDSDGDGRGDVCDCAPGDPAVRTPGDPWLTATRTAPDVLRLEWSWPVGADVFRVSRGLAANLELGDYGSCFAASLAASSWDDGFVPASGTCLTYLVQPVSAACGAGSLGKQSSGIERTNLSVYACP